MATKGKNATFKIQNTATGEWWSNGEGWVGARDAATFTDEERRTLNLPVGGVWVLDGRMRVTERTVAALYKRAFDAYQGSYAMMVDDAFRGGGDFARRKNIEWLFDAGVFPAMYRLIRAHRWWDDLDSDAREELVRLANSY